MRVRPTLLNRRLPPPASLASSVSSGDRSLLGTWGPSSSKMSRSAGARAVPSGEGAGFRLDKRARPNDHHILRNPLRHRQLIVTGVRFAGIVASVDVVTPWVHACAALARSRPPSGSSHGIAPE